MNSKTNKKPVIILSIILLVVFAFLAFFTPYTNDDWAWGDKIGADRLASFFAGYNGRYLGNLLIILISNSRAALVLFMAVSFYAACLIPCLFSKSVKLPTLLLSSILFFLLQRSIYAQVISFASGYTNYMPPVLLLALYFVIIKNIFEENEVKYPKFMPVLTLLIGFCGALFMENITITNIAIGAVIIIYTLIKYKKVYFTHVSFLIGAVCGAIFMFSNSAYGIISKGGDDYRSLASGSGGLIKTVYDHLNGAVNYMFVWNVYFCLIATVLFCLICAAFIRQSENKKSRAFSMIICAVNVFSLVVFFVKYKYPAWEIHSQKAMNVFMWGIAGLYCLSLLAGIILCVKNKAAKFKLLLLYITVLCMVAPLMVVNPISARCYYPPYFIMCLMVVEMFVYYAGLVKPDKSAVKTLSLALAGGLCAFCIFYLTIFSSIHSFDVMRGEYIEKQNANHEKVVVVTTLPYDNYLTASSPKNKLWKDRFKVYYDIDENSDIKYVSYKKYKKFAENYDKKHPSEIK